MISVQVPATSANLGPGFDCLGLALCLYNKIIVKTDQPFKITLTGPYTSGISLEQNNLVWHTMCLLWQTVGFSIPSVSLTLESHIPPARGLGSSSAAIVGGLLAANTLAGNPLNQFELIQMATKIEGHPDNVTPALIGGITLAVPTNNGILSRILTNSPKIRAVVVVPELLLKTNTARGVLPPKIFRREAVFNIAHVALLVEAIIKEEYQLLREGMLDQLHQNQRAVLIPGMHDTLKAALEAGAFGAALSGSGPTLLALTAPEAEVSVSDAMITTFMKHSIQAQVYVLDIDTIGAQVF